MPDCIEADRAVLPHSPLGLLHRGFGRVMINAWKYGSEEIHNLEALGAWA
ncbi:hypothetical protein RBWH47_00719 [Rhodopirellula baltica WH47]|uniref:Uncharacterized protein n=1 Tax=Rhodopirellula baltica WH47 TaxID=991778 RepID=F2AQW6_RHOBT|nr:hypothetical protein RBWH47_00719 [Rhodopirellula baltica WH47]